jgi:Tol biopolymer transport system component
VLAGCGRIGFDPGVDASPDGRSPSDGAVTDAAEAATPGRCSGPFSWSTPHRIAELASSASDRGPAISRDNQLLVFSSERASKGSLYLAKRQGAAWSTPTFLSNLNRPDCDNIDPAWNASGTRLYFARFCGGDNRLYVSTYSGGTFSAPSRVAGLQTTEAFGPTLAADELEMFYTAASSNVIARATRASLAAAWVDQGQVAELGTANDPGWPSLSSDARTIFVERTASGSSKIFTGERPAAGARFGALGPVVETNDPTANDGDPDLAWDCETLYFASDRSGGRGAADLYVVTRTN